MDQNKKDQFIIKKGTFVGIDGVPNGWHLGAVGAGNDEIFMSIPSDGRVFIGGELDVELTAERQKIMKEAKDGSPVYQLQKRLMALGVTNLGFTPGSSLNLTPDQIATEFLKFLDQMEAGTAELVPEE